MKLHFSKKSILLAVIFVSLFWALLLFFSVKSNGSIRHRDEASTQVRELEEKINQFSKALHENKSYLAKLHKQLESMMSDEAQFKAEAAQKIVPEAAIATHKIEPVNQGSYKIEIPVVVFVYNRPTVTRCLDLLLKYKDSTDDTRFHVVVSQDGNHQETTQAIERYGDKITHLRHPDESASIKAPPNHKNLIGYYKISLHYKWAISKIFETFPSANAVIIMEDDLDISPDFFKYFRATYDVLLNDDTLYCTSAWNDNGKEGLVNNEATTALYRSDFFPGLGWMMKKSTWSEMGPKWPAAFWDDWFREPDQRKGRACIRPEISRTKTFGRVGVSNGQFYDKHLKFIKLNDIDVDWKKQNLTYLDQGSYDRFFLERVYSLPSVTLQDLQSGSIANPDAVRLEYSSAASFKASAKALGLMEDFKSGVPRTAYHGVVNCLYRGSRVYLSPSLPWPGYDVSWR